MIAQLVIVGICAGIALVVWGLTAFVAQTLERARREDEDERAYWKRVIHNAQIDVAYGDCSSEYLRAAIKEYRRACPD